MPRITKTSRVNLPKTGFQVNYSPAQGANSTAEILLYGDVGFDFAASDFIARLESLGNVSSLDIRIASPGGLAADGITIYQALARNPAQKNVFVDSIAYSAASVIAMAASPGKLKMAFNSRMMMHEGMSIVFGTSGEMRNEADSLDLLNKAIAVTYAKRMNAPVDKVRQMMAATTYFGAEEALAAGLADEIFEGDEVEGGANGDDEYNLATLFQKRDRKNRERANASDQQLIAGDAEEVERQFTAKQVLDRWQQIRQHEAA